MTEQNPELGYVDRALERGVDAVETISNPEARSFARGFLSLDYSEIGSGLYEMFTGNDVQENVSFGRKMMNSEIEEKGDIETPIVDENGDYFPDNQSKAYMAGMAAAVVPSLAAAAGGDAGLLAPTAAVSGASLANYTEQYLTEE
jgi:hypothetical protein